MATGRTPQLSAAGRLIRRLKGLGDKLRYADCKADIIEVRDELTKIIDADDLEA